MTYLPRVVEHSALKPAELTALRALFDREYRAVHGEWDPEQPYGYAPASTHAIVFDAGGSAVAHVGFQRREITVGHTQIAVAGTGGVLVDDRLRGQGLGELAMSLARGAMRAAPDLEYGYLGCREDVVPFYERTGWHRIHVVERSTARSLPPETMGRAETGVEAVVEAGSPVLISPIRQGVDPWPPGVVDLRGRPW
ncbi:GNAT family N-acetyltransferase [Pseudoclavibacter sp. 8L]|uniref:GNAT family N-acetyltransferase n=1 Tax=Pseudoclavibacter sp. 8L TaxID=2653162 RepID=UPI0012EF53CD|nr:GNAT family N-acetyltransferase [Pseudoclavibacter sp. 8L]VXB52251.1 GNAT family N-acetyltransferase [Pseudoclavibacter sp. 8L]